MDVHVCLRQLQVVVRRPFCLLHKSVQQHHPAFSIDVKQHAPYPIAGQSGPHFEQSASHWPANGHPHRPPKFDRFNILADSSPVFARKALQPLSDWLASGTCPEEDRGKPLAPGGCRSGRRTSMPSRSALVLSLHSVPRKVQLVSCSWLRSSAIRTPHPLPNKELTSNHLTNLIDVLTCTVTSLNATSRLFPQTSIAPQFSQSGPTFLTPLFSQPSVLTSLQPLCFDNHLDCLCLKLPNHGPAYVNLRTYPARRGFRPLRISRPNLSSVRIVGLKESPWL